MTSVTLPLLVFEGDDLSTFETVEAACDHLEAIDVRNGEFDSFDAEGFPVELLTSGYAVVGARRIEDQAPAPRELAERLRAYLSEVGGAALPTDLPDLVRAAADRSWT